MRIYRTILRLFFENPYRVQVRKSYTLPTGALSFVSCFSRRAPCRRSGFAMTPVFFRREDVAAAWAAHAQTAGDARAAAALPVVGFVHSALVKAVCSWRDLAVDVVKPDGKPVAEAPHRDQDVEAATADGAAVHVKMLGYCFYVSICTIWSRGR